MDWALVKEGDSSKAKETSHIRIEEVSVESRKGVSI